ncbi:hypothetical protein V6N12_001764 [Hibiscus sabdariffa]|uniref:Uncharacterized protein n=1 Tax=Hibiscus sabdariffa TaxID=183260 RepID=A0ABR2BRB1_9ROSI
MWVKLFKVGATVYIFVKEYSIGPPNVEILAQYKVWLALVRCCGLATFSQPSLSWTVLTVPLSSTSSSNSFVSPTIM